jgi:dihydrofolate reductase
VQELAALKQEPGGEIIAHGGTQFVRSLIRLGLVDEYRLWVLPAAHTAGGIDQLPESRRIRS